MEAQPAPTWLDPDFLYRINYGPATRDYVERARDILRAAKTVLGARPTITLLDREMAKKLHQAIFSKSRIDLFKTDWTEDDTHVPDGRQVILNPKIPQTPFRLSTIRGNGSHFMVRRIYSFLPMVRRLLVHHSGK